MPGDVVLQLKSPYHDGTTHVVMSALELMQRLAALVPRPRLHLIRFHGVLAPNARLRPEIIPSSGRQAGDLPVPGFPSVPLNAHTPSLDPAEAPPPAAPARLSWARLLKRVFEIDLEHCPHCGGLWKIIADIEHPLSLPNPHPPRLARPGTAPIARAVIRSIPNGLIPARDPLPPGSTP